MDACMHVRAAHCKNECVVLTLSHLHSLFIHDSSYNANYSLVHVILYICAKNVLFQSISKVVVGVCIDLPQLSTRYI